MSKAYKSLGCEASYCTSQHYAGGLCRKHYKTSTAAHPAGKGVSQSKIDALLLENIEMGFEIDELHAQVAKLASKVARLTRTNQCLQNRLDT
jgi:hypothetical protein